MSDNSRRWIVITTINRPTEAIRAVSNLCAEGWNGVAVGDLKTPPDWHADGIRYLSVSRQRELFGDLAEAIPYRHYSRKNLGYLYAIHEGADVILDTDDDNIPGPDFGRGLQRRLKGQTVRRAGWVNIYAHYSSAPIWPRGLPLDEIHSTGEMTAGHVEADCPIQQYLVDGDPDVDAIYRLIFKNPLVFDKREAPLVVDAGAWVPFNSQNTAFFSGVFALLYLPCFVSFRMTDIWRSLVAQRALWTHGLRLAMQNATVKQVRNEHNLMHDFNDEVVGYQNNARISALLDQAAAKLSASERMDVADTARALWLALVREKIIPARELTVLESWLEAVHAARSHAPRPE